MRYATRKGGNRIISAETLAGCGRRPIRGNRRNFINLLIIISIVFFVTNALSEETPLIRGVQIELEGGNRICMSFEGKITGIIVNGTTNLPGETFENITKVGGTKISRSRSGMLTRVGHAGIFRDRRGNIIKIGNAKVFRKKNGAIIAVNGDPHISPLYAIDTP